MLRAVIFDMDGLMVDTEYLHHESFKAVLEQYGVKPAMGERGVIHISGVSAETNWEHFKQQYGFQADNNDLNRRKGQIHVAWLREKVVAMPGLLKLLKDLRAHRLKMAIASSSIREHIDLITAKLDITNYFDAIVSGQEVSHSKPAPDIFLRAAQKLAVNPSECVVLEDAISGIQAAKAAHMKAVAVPNQFTNHESFDMADAVIDSLKEAGSKMLSSLVI